MVTNLQLLTAYSKKSTNPVYLPKYIQDIVDAQDADALAKLADLDIKSQINIYEPLLNAISRDVIFDLTGGWDDNISRLFIRDANDMGEFTRMLCVDADETENVEDDEMYSEDGDNSPFKGSAKPKIGVSYIETSYKKRWTVDKSVWELRRAFSNPYGFGELASLILGSLQVKAKIFLYKETLTNLWKIKKEAVISPAKMTDQQSCLLQTGQIMTLAGEIKNITAGTKFNDYGFRSTTNPNSLVFLVNLDQSVATKINVNASLLGFDRLGFGGLFRDVETYTSGESGDALGYIVDRDKYRIELTVNETMADVNGNRGYVRYTQHSWVKSGFNPAINGVKLVATPSAPAVEIYNDENKALACKAYPYAVNHSAVVVYTSDGTEPTKDSAQLGADGIVPSFSKSKTYKFAVLIDEEGLEGLVSPIVTVTDGAIA